MSFEVLDVDNDGVISPEDISRACRGRVSIDVAKDILVEAGADRAPMDFDKVLLLCS